jgi:hypothetical protein
VARASLRDAPTNNIAIPKQSDADYNYNDKVVYCIDFTAQLSHDSFVSRTEMMCQLAPGFTRTDGILAPEFCACHGYPQLEDRRVGYCKVVFSTLPCVDHPVTTSSAPSVK